MSSLVIHPECLLAFAWRRGPDTVIKKHRVPTYTPTTIPDTATAPATSTVGSKASTTAATSVAATAASTITPSRLLGAHWQVSGRGR